MLSLLRLVLALAAVTGCLVVASPAMAQTTIAYQATFVENGAGQVTCPPGTACGSATISGFGHVAFQSIVFDHPALPASLRERMYRWLDENAQSERKSTDSDEQFYYKARKKAIGPFKQELWGLPEDVRQQVSADLQKTFAFLFEQLGIGGTAELIRRFITAPLVRHGALGGIGVQAVDDPDADE